MSMEEDAPKNKERRRLLEGFALGVGSDVTGGVLGAAGAIKEGVEKINSRWLTPAAIDQLRKETGASDKDILKAEGKIKYIILEELKRGLK